jgi:hypothetical protein
LADANPYQFNIKKIIRLNQDVRIWAKREEHLSRLERGRADSLALILKNNLIPAEGENSEVMTFSRAVPHGENNSESVMMTRIEEDFVFVHASDIQLLNERSIHQILSWKPDIVLAGGPPLYLAHKFSKESIRNAWHNAKSLALGVDTLILDHHLMRNFEGIKWIKRLSGFAKGRVICSADWMKKPRMLLEARRRQLYRDMPVPEAWHEDYAKGRVNTDEYWNRAQKLYKGVKLGEAR